MCSLGTDTSVAPAMRSWGHLIGLLTDAVDIPRKLGTSHGHAARSGTGPHGRDRTAATIALMNERATDPYVIPFARRRRPGSR